MTYSGLQTPATAVSGADERADPLARLRATSAFRGGGIPAWTGSKIAMAGGGVVGGRLAVEMVRSGATVFVADFDIGHTENTGTQLVEAGVPKVETVVAACERIRGGRAEGLCTDIRHVGIGVLRECQALVDVSDDPNLAYPLTEISNGLGIPLIRCAVDGSGEMEFGRVLCSHGGDGYACQLCTQSLADLRRPRWRQACPAGGRGSRPPTLAGGAMAAAITGLGLLQVQRLVTGNDRDLVLDREVVIDLSNFQVFAARLERSGQCLSGHRRWELVDCDALAARTTFAELLAIARRELRARDVALAGYLHPLCTQAACDCGRSAVAVGTEYTAAPRCPGCGNAMSWLHGLQVHRIGQRVAATLGALDRSLLELGYPERGALFVARDGGGRACRLVLA